MEEYKGEMIAFLPAPRQMQAGRVTDMVPAREAVADTVPSGITNEMVFWSSDKISTPEGICCAVKFVSADG